MIDFNREVFPRNNEQTPDERLKENLKMQRDCEIEIERCREANEIDNLEKTQKTLEALKIGELEIRK